MDEATVRWLSVVGREVSTAIQQLSLILHQGLGTVKVCDGTVAM
jgi:hypothetical protein